MERVLTVLAGLGPDLPSRHPALASLAAALQAESEQQQPDNKNLAVNGNHNGNHPAAMSRSLGSSVIRCHT